MRLDDVRSIVATYRRARVLAADAGMSGYQLGMILLHHAATVIGLFHHACSRVTRPTLVPADAQRFGGLDDIAGTCVAGDPVAGRCWPCGAQACPHGEVLHFHADGCPACEEYADQVTSDAYQAYVQSCARDCRCCPTCSPEVCAGALGGGVCDQVCRCADREDYFADVLEDVLEDSIFWHDRPTKRLAAEEETSPMLAVGRLLHTSDMWSLKVWNGLRPPTRAALLLLVRRDRQLTPPSAAAHRTPQPKPSPAEQYWTPERLQQEAVKQGVTKAAAPPHGGTAPSAPQGEPARERFLTPPSVWMELFHHNPPLAFAVNDNSVDLRQCYIAATEVGERVADAGALVFLPQRRCDNPSPCDASAGCAECDALDAWERADDHLFNLGEVG